MIGRARFGRIAIANSDSGAAAYTDSAIDQAYRASTGTFADLKRQCAHMTATPGPLFALALASISLIGPLAVHLFMPVIPAVRAALGLSASLGATDIQHCAVRHGALATLFYGSLSDRYGRRPVLLSGLALFLVGSALSAVADVRRPAGARPARAGDRRRLRH